MQTNIPEIKLEEIGDQNKEKLPLRRESKIERKDSDEDITKFRESRLGNELPINGIRVNYPKNKSTALIPYKTFEIDFEWKRKARHIERRFSNIELLRISIGVILPFTYVPPAHFKKIQVSNEKSFLEFRTEQLNIFFKYIEENKSLFNIRLVKSTNTPIF